MERWLEGKKGYEDAPVGTKIAYCDGGYGGYTKVSDGRWKASDGNLYESSILRMNRRKVTYWPEKDPYAVGKIIEGVKAYDNAPLGTQVSSILGTLTKTATGWKERTPAGAIWTFIEGDLRSPRKVTARLAEWEVDLLYPSTPAPTITPDPRIDGEATIKYSHNKAKGTVYTYEGYVHQDFGRVVKLAEGRYLAVPNRTPREFLTEQDAINYLL